MSTDSGRNAAGAAPFATAVYVAEQLEAAESEIDNARALPSLPVDRLACVARAFRYLAEASKSLAPWEEVSDAKR